MEGARSLMARVAGSLILSSQLLLLWVALEPNGTTAIWFSFVGTPLLVAGCALAFWTFRRGDRQADRGSRHLESAPSDRRGV